MKGRILFGFLLFALGSCPGHITSPSERLILWPGLVLTVALSAFCASLFQMHTCRSRRSLIGKKPFRAFASL